MKSMKIPKGEDVCCAADLFEYDEAKKLNLRQFFSHYKDQFPMLIVIIGGYYGETKYDCYDNLQVLRVHCYTSQPRVVADDARLNPQIQKGYITIPEDTLIKFRLVKGHTQLGGPQQLWELLQENDRLPLIVQTACDYRYPIKIGTTRYEAKDLGNIMIKEKYEEHFLLMNAIDTVELDMNKLTCMACLSEELDAAPITGFKYASKAEFDEFCRKLANDVAESGESYDTSQGNGDFGEYSFDEMRSLLQISNNATGLLTEEEDEEDDPDGDNYEEIPPLIPSRNPILKQTTPDQSSDDQLHKEVKETHKPPLIMKHSTHSPKSPNSPKVHHKERDAKTVLGFLKKKLIKSDDKDDEPLDESEEHSGSKDGHKTNNEQLTLPPRVPTHAKTSESKIDSYSYADVKAGYVKISAHKPYINTQIGRATVKPMQQVKNKDVGKEYVEMSIGDKKEEDYEDGEQFYDMLDENITQITANPTKNLSKRTTCANMQEDSGISQDNSEDMEEYGTIEIARSVRQGRVQNPVSSKAPVPAPKPLKLDDEHFSDSEQQIPSNVPEKADSTANVKQMSINEICEHLKSLKLEKYTGAFEEYQIDGLILTSLSVEDLQKELGLRKIEAIKLNKFVTTGHIPR